MSEEQANISTKLNGKKLGIIGAVLLILIALLVGISIYNTPANRLSRQLDLGQRYLEEQNYEQAILEFDKAIAIDPMSVEAYLGKADAYIGLGDLQSALDTLQTSYDLTGDERLKKKVDEIQEQLSRGNQSKETTQPVEELEVQEKQDCTELPFSVSDITIMGYDLLEPHFDELVEAFGIPMEQSGDSTYGYIDSPYGVNVNNLSRPTYDESTINAYISSESNSVGIDIIYDDSDGTYAEWLVMYDDSIFIDGDPSLGLGVQNIMNRNDMETVCDLPVYPEDTYDDWCDKMGVEMIKSSKEARSLEDRQYWSSISDIQRILTEDRWYVENYFEQRIIDSNIKEDMYARIELLNEAGLRFEIEAYFDDGIIVVMYFYCIYLSE